MISRRNFLAGSLAAVPAVGLLSRIAGAQAGGFRIGCQSYSFRKFPYEVAIAKLKELGLTEMEFCAVHFKPDAGDPAFAKVKETIAASGIKVSAYGVEGFSKDAAANRKKFEFAKALGIEILSADPSPDSFDNLDELCKEFNIKIAIHNHGPKASYDKVADTLKAVEGHSPLIGACVDTGHAIRSGEKPHEVIKALGARVHSLHLKDWKLGGKEQIIGKGDLDLAAVVKELKAINFAGPISMEYEESEDNPVPDMKVGLANWNKAASV
ncbi:MAG: sugar phosphate isomerase/epimerase [Candidatus Hydrogenedentes bacterium]|nr:sugar phosphate isomerase/epimerase [Candidatus Hydrogenedentota bacterium]